MYSLSASSLKDFMSCKIKYYYRKLDGTYVTTVPLVRGTVVHEIIENYELGKIGGSKEAHLELNKELSLALTDENIEFTRYDSIPKVIKSSHKMLDNYFELKEGEVIDVEKSFDIPMANGLYRLIGRIDQIIRYGDNKIAIVDLKTSAKEPTQFEILGDYQFTIYALAAQHLYEGSELSVFNFHLLSGKHIEYPRSTQDVSNMKKLMFNVASELEDIKGNWQDCHKNKGWHCNRCPYRLLCYNVEE